MELDDWQKDVLETKGHMLLCSGRQVGKSTIVSIKAGKAACTNKDFSVLIISATERQAEELFNKTLFYIQDNFKHLIKRGKDKPTKHVIKLTNGSIIRCLPTGLSGMGIRGFTINLLIADEAAFINEEVWAAVTPMLLTTGGDVWLLSTPHGRAGYFYERYQDPSFKVFHVNSEEVITNRKITPTWTPALKEKILEHLDREKKTMSERQYAQEYLGQFVDDLRQFFTDDLIKSVMKLKRRSFIVEAKYYLGVDIARMGDDEITYEILMKINDRFEHIESIVKKKQRLNETTKDILELDKRYKFINIFMDDGGIGVGVFDYLLENPQTKNKIVALNNRARPLDPEERHKKKILKEDLYNNLLMLMQHGKIQLLDDDEIFQSLKSVQYEYITKEKSLTKLRIFGNYTHIAEGLIRAAEASKDKHLKLWVSYN